MVFSIQCATILQMIQSIWPCHLTSTPSNVANAVNAGTRKGNYMNVFLMLKEQCCFVVSAPNSFEKDLDKVGESVSGDERTKRINSIIHHRSNLLNLQGDSDAVGTQCTNKTYAFMDCGMIWSIKNRISHSLFSPFLSVDFFFTSLFLYLFLSAVCSPPFFFSLNLIMKKKLSVWSAPPPPPPVRSSALRSWTSWTWSCTTTPGTCSSSATSTPGSRSGGSSASSSTCSRATRAWAWASACGPPAAGRARCQHWRTARGRGRSGRRARREGGRRRPAAGSPPRTTWTRSSTAGSSRMRTNTQTCICNVKCIHIITHIYTDIHRRWRRHQRPKWMTKT